MTLLPFKPINALEKKIFSDREFLIAIQAGRIRQWHTEGTVRNHIIHILRYIDKHYKKHPDYETLRIIALLHDTGKFARLYFRPNNYLPDGSKAQQKKLIAASKAFSKKYRIPPMIAKKIEPYIYTSQHAYTSYLFAKKFLKDRQILEIIKYHDIAQDFKDNERTKKKYDKSKFKKIFLNLDIDIYQIFIKCDKCNHADDLSPWFKKQLRLHKIE